MKQFSKTPFHSVSAALPILIPSEWGEENGALQTADSSGALIFIAVRIVTTRELKPETIRAKLKGSEWNFFAGVNTTITHYNCGDIKKLNAGFGLLAPTLMSPQNTTDEKEEPTMSPSAFAKFFVDKICAGQDAKAASFWLGGMVNQQLCPARLVYWRIGKNFDLFDPNSHAMVKVPQFGLGIFCPDYKTAMIVKLMLSKLVRVCPYCGGMFEPRRSDQLYCSARHRDAQRLARWREEQERKRKVRRKK